MTEDTLATLLRLRHAAVDDARRGLAAALRREAEAESVLAHAEAQITRETETAMASIEDADVEVFAAWLPTGRSAVKAAALSAEAAVAGTAEARTALALARAAAEATATLIEQRRSSMQQVADRRAQAALDEAGSRRRRASDQ